MSLANKGDGDGVIERYICRYRNLPYLRRNVRQSIHALTTMGAVVSSIAGSSPFKAIGDRVWAADETDEEEDEEEAASRPAKRRKISKPTSQIDSNLLQSRFPSKSPRRKPFGQVTNGSRTAQARLGLAAKLQPVQPSAFYGRSATMDGTNTRLESVNQPKEQRQLSTRGLDRILTPCPIEFKRALRLEIFGIEPKPYVAEEPICFMRDRGGPIESRCRCTVALFFRDDTRGIPNPDSCEVYRKSKTCVLRTSVTTNGEVTRELRSLEPFLISAEELYVNRKERGPLGGQLCTFELAEKYHAQAFLEPVGSQKDWPPFDIPSGDDMLGTVAVQGVVSRLVHTREADKSCLQLCCNIPGLLQPDKQNRTAELKLVYGKEKETLPYCLRLSTKWSLPTCFNLMRTPKTDPACLTTARKTITEGSPSPFEALEEDPATPSRAKRYRADIPTYNIKALTYGTAKASKTSRLKRLGGSSSSGESNCRLVIYSFGKSDASGYGINPSTTVWGLTCPFCGYGHANLEDLRLHLHTNHCNFKFTLYSSDAAKPKFSIELAKSTPLSSTLDQRMLNQRTFQLSTPQTLFNLDQFLNGDNSWVKGRQGPLHNQWPEHIVNLSESSSSSSLYGSRHSSPNTSNTDVVSVDIDHSTKLPLHRRRFHVPITKHNKPLYDAVSKRILAPGEELPESDNEADEGWLHQKHRDIILDFTDVSANEKDYILQWNPFIIEAHLTREDQLQPALKRFVESHINWFLERPSRRVELGKQLENFVTRGIVTNDFLTSAIHTLRRAEKEASTGVNVPAIEEQAGLTKLRGFLDCACGEITKVGQERIICRGPKCQNRYFHSSCASRSGRPVQGRWLCDDCVA